MFIIDLPSFTPGEGGLLPEIFGWKCAYVFATLARFRPKYCAI